MATLNGPELLLPVPASQVVRLASSPSQSARRRSLVASAPNANDPALTAGQRAAASLQGVAQPAYGKRFAVALVSVIVISAAASVLGLITKDSNYNSSVIPSPTAVDGLTIFAVFFVAALAIERALEPFANAFNIENNKAAATSETDKAKTEVEKLAASGSNPTEAQKTSAKNSLDAAVVKVQDVSESAFWRQTIFWGIATVLAMAASALLHLYLLRTVGIASGNRTLEVLATGLIIGAGTQPLHDLTTTITAKKETTAGETP